MDKKNKVALILSVIGCGAIIAFIVYNMNAEEREAELATQGRGDSGLVKDAIAQAKDMGMSKDEIDTIKAYATGKPLTPKQVVISAQIATKGRG